MPGPPRTKAPRQLVLPSPTVQAMRRRWRRLTATRDQGSSTVELTVATPLLVGLLLFVVLCGRLVEAQLDLDAAARSGARAASLARTVPAATADAEQAAMDTLAAHGVTCAQPSITVETGGLQPGGAVTVTVSCVVPLADLALIGVPGTRTVSATSTSPVDRWRGGPPT